MNTEPLEPDNFLFETMYKKTLFFRELIDRSVVFFRHMIAYLDAGGHSDRAVKIELAAHIEAIDDGLCAFDNAKVTDSVNSARKSVRLTVDRILNYFGIEVELEDMYQERNW